MALARVAQLSEDDHQLLFRFLARLHNDDLRKFLKEKRLPPTGVKDVLLERLRDTLATGAINYNDLISLLDQTEPWGKQHIIFYSPPRSLRVSQWRDANRFASLLKGKMLSLYNSPRHLFLPEELTLSSIVHDGAKLRITAVQKRVWWEHDAEHDRYEQVEDSRLYRKAYIERIARGLVSFEWDFHSNLAMLQISQLPSFAKYETSVDLFRGRVSSFLDLQDFPVADLRKAIATLHQWTDENRYPLRYHEVGYQKGGRSLSGKSATPKDALSGDEIIDEAMERMRTEGGIATDGNFFFLTDSNRPGGYKGPDIHVILNAHRGRVNFPANNTEEGVRYVVRCIRQAGQ